MEEMDRYEPMNPLGDSDLLNEGLFANPINKTFPIATESDIRSSWRYINNPDNTAQYDNHEIEMMKDRIKQAALLKTIELEIQN